MSASRIRSRSTGRIIVPADSTYWRIAFSVAGDPTAWQLCLRDKPLSKQSLREHLHTPGQYYWKRGDDLELATPADISFATAAGIDPRPCILPRTDSEILPERRGSKSGRAGSASAQGGAQGNAAAARAGSVSAQGNAAPLPQPQAPAAADAASGASADPKGVAAAVPAAVQGPGVIFRTSYEYAGRLYVLHDDDMWYYHGSST